MVVGCAHCGLVELFAEVAHVIVPIHPHAFWGHELGYSEYGEFSGQGGKFGNGMFEAALALGDEGELCGVRLGHGDVFLEVHQNLLVVLRRLGGQPAALLKAVISSESDGGFLVHPSRNVRGLMFSGWWHAVRKLGREAWSPKAVSSRVVGGITLSQWTAMGATVSNTSPSGSKDGSVSLFFETPEPTT